MPRILREVEANCNGGQRYKMVYIFCINLLYWQVVINDIDVDHQISLSIKVVVESGEFFVAHFFFVCY